jgi:cell division septum initiation protein DivIVA
MLQSNEDLHDRVEKLQERLEELKQETIKLGEENAQAQALILEKEREK